MNMFILDTATPTPSVSSDGVITLGAIKIFSGTYAGKYGVNEAFLSDDILAGSPQNTEFADMLNACPQSDIDPADLVDPNAPTG